MGATLANARTFSSFPCTRPATSTRSRGRATGGMMASSTVWRKLPASTLIRLPSQRRRREPNRCLKPRRASPSSPRRGGRPSTRHEICSSWLLRDTTNTLSADRGSSRQRSSLASVWTEMERPRGLSSARLLEPSSISSQWTFTTAISVLLQLRGQIGFVRSMMKKQVVPPKMPLMTVMKMLIFLSQCRTLKKSPHSAATRVPAVPRIRLPFYLPNLVKL
mmetsp:Transcript_17034/g.36946  ORF Transcript_17034/g.36946 Transcript_17034/m.36946 type:complete len:220 (+) Transcript_17034:1527-2186(+)